MHNIREKTRRITMLAMLLALIMILSILEHMLPPLPLLPANVRLGLSNVVTMYTLFFMGKKYAISLMFLKSMFTVLLRGVTAGMLSFCGGILSICTLILLLFLFKDKISYLILSIFGAIMHNIGQIIAASVIMGVNLVLFYLPVLIIAGVVLGSVTGILLRVVMPLFHKHFDNKWTGRES